jgi:hypothetical protein
MRTTTSPPDVETRQVVQWRYDELVRAGWGQRDALFLAMHGGVDLHVACDLIRRGCPPQLARRILT